VLLGRKRPDVGGPLRGIAEDELVGGGDEPRDDLVVDGTGGNSRRPARQTWPAC